MTDLGHRIRCWREAAGLNQSDLARLVEAHASAVSHWESGRHAPTAEMIGRIADACGISMAQFYGPLPPPRDNGSAAEAS
jgi:transcriptional regulator with XRE-family HTH domain